jgi:hypothetical protein
MLLDLTESKDRQVQILVRELEKELPASYEATIEREGNEFRVRVKGVFSYMIPADQGLQSPIVAANIAGRTLRELVKGANK